MRYLGGKEKYGNRIVSLLNQRRQEGAPFYDVFTGGLSVVYRMKGERHANDACGPLILLYESWRDGWRPQVEINEAKFYEIKERNDPLDPLTAFSNFALSYSGWGSGYARGYVKPGTKTCCSASYPGAEPQDFVAQATRALDKKLRACKGVTFTALDFEDVSIPDGALVYLDPPYRGTAGYGFFGNTFDHDRFSDWAIKLSKRCVVLLSEYDAPHPWTEIWSRTTSKNIAKAPRTEKVFEVIDYVSDHAEGHRNICGDRDKHGRS